MATKLLHLSSPITCICFNADKSQMAVGLANSKIEIYSFQRPNSWNKTHTLTKHTSRVTGIDWAPNTGKLVTCGSDRNAYVWDFVNGDWEPTLVLLRIGRAATCAKWSPREDKFAVGSSARLISVCFFETTQQCWVSKHIKKPIKSTIVSIDWHPNNILIAAGSTDYRCRVFSAWVKEVEAKPEANSWGSKLPFGQLLSEFICTGWVNAVSFSPSGDHVAFASQDATLSIGWGGSNDALITSYGKFLPFTNLEWIKVDEIVAVGHDRMPHVFKLEESGLAVYQGRHTGKGSSGGQSDQNFAMNRFRNMDLNKQTTSVEITTAHQSPICDIRITVGEKGNVQQFATCGGDGLIFLWPWDRLAGSLTE